MKNLYLQLLDILSADFPVALATVTKTVGSTPQKAGSSAIFTKRGLLSGTVGGGIVEGKIQQAANNSLLSKDSGYFQFQLNRETTNGEDAICGGRIDILVDASPLDHRIVLEELKQSLESRFSGVLVTIVNFTLTDKVQILRYWLTKESKIPIELSDLTLEIKQVLSDGNMAEFREITVNASGLESTVFIEPVIPPPHLVIAGAGHIGKALSHIGKLLEFEITVIDDRKEYANSANLPDADHIIVEDIGKAMDELNIAHDTYVVIVTRGHKDDANALRSCIGSEAAYVGMIGSKNKVSLMREEFIRKGWAEPGEWKDIHAPVGIDIHSQSVQEIAISIAAQLIQVKNVKTPAYV